MSTPEYLLIAGATGRQGGATIDALLSHPDFKIEPRKVYAITRNATGLGAVKLREKYSDINIVPGDLNSPEAIFQHLDKNIVTKTGVFLAQGHGPTELSDAKGFIDAVASNGVPYFVYSSDRGGHKFYIEQHLRSVCSSSQMEYTILRPTWFADNAWWGFPGQLCMTGWRENMEGKRMQVTVTKDIGRWAVEGLVRPDRTGIRNQALSIASDELSFKNIDDIFVQHTRKGVPVTYGLLARFIIWMVKDLRTMFGFIGERAYGADLPWLKSQLEPTTFEQWVRNEVPRG
ncbi:NmrA domain-containing protein [Fusarium sp. LHS14.1]|nr:NmrA domain-containing protein [Fusarium sp. LHS14.1]